MTIGTSIMCASFLFPSFCFMFTCHTPPRRNADLAGEDRKWSASFCQLRGLAIQKIEGLFAADSVSDSIEAPILCQTSADRFRSLFCLLGEGCNLVIHIVFPGLDFFQIRDAFQ